MIHFTTRATLALLASFTLYWLVALPLDTRTDQIQQAALGVTAWVFLGAALARQRHGVRVQVAVLVVVATALEVIGSIVWRAYVYRLDNLPLYVPAGHGLFYLVALRTAALPRLERHARAITVAVTAGATAWMIYGLLRSALPDLLGLVVWAVFVRFMVRGRYPLLYAVSFVMTMALELYGTALGIWRWAPLLPGLWLPAGNPPSCIGAGYAAMDALTRRIVATARRRVPTTAAAPAA
ncbi:MAG: hypothetical protein ACRDF0_08675 [Candidatus Limnocylindria bacterium]